MPAFGFGANGNDAAKGIDIAAKIASEKAVTAAQKISEQATNFVSKFSGGQGFAFGAAPAPLAARTFQNLITPAPSDNSRSK